MHGLQRIVWPLAVCVLAGALAAQEVPPDKTRGTLRGPRAGSSSFPTPAFDASGRLWLAFIERNVVYVTSSDDLGRSFNPAVAVNRVPEAIDANGEARPKIAALADGTLLTTWTKKLDKPFTGLVRFSRSTDGGKSFAEPITINDDGLLTGHRFDALGVTLSNEVVIAWIDKRDLEGARAAGDAYAGAAIYVALSRDGGRSFEPNRKVKDHVCECCRLSVAVDSSGQASLLFRDLLEGGIRDHSLARAVSRPGRLRVHRVTYDDWQIDGCPHHGPSLWIGPGDVYHITWFTAGKRSGTGVFYARSTDGGRTFGQPRAMGARSAGHPFVLGAGRQTYLVWKEADGGGSTVRLRVSHNGGESWSAGTTVARAAGGADHPLLVSNGRDVFLSWFTKDVGYRLIRLSPSEASEREGR